MKIIAGKHRSRSIKYYKSDTTRPTSNMVREGVFNMLSNISDEIVLDLFAGSGAYGLESLSRGAKFVYFNDINRMNIKIINDNLISLNELENAKVNNLDWEKAINYYQNNEINFDLIFIDPPYFEKIYEKVIPLAIKRLNKNGRIVVEISKEINLDLEKLNVEVLKDRNYGSKRILILTHI